jgi:hypothetical protein
MSFYYVKIIATNNTSTVFSTMISETVVNTSRFELELAVLAIEPKFESEAEVKVNPAGKLIKINNDDRVEFDITLYPFSNFEAISSDVPQNTDTLILLRSLLKYKSIWITLPASPRECTPRYQDAATFPLTSSLLPCKCVNTDNIDVSLAESEGETEVKLTLKKYTIN